MQAWSQVKVTNEQSGYVGQAGYVIRNEKAGDVETVFVKLDATGETVGFQAAELVLL